MPNVITIDPGISKCGMVIADINKKKVFKAEIVKSKFLVKYVKEKYQKDKKLVVLIGNGTSSKTFIKELKNFIPNLIIAEEKNSTFRAKQRYFEIFPLTGVKRFLPREIFILDKNLDSLAALIIMEDYFKCKFYVSKKIVTKTWLK